MAMAWIWTGMVVLSLIFGILSGNLDEVANADWAPAMAAFASSSRFPNSEMTMRLCTLTQK